MFEKNHFTQHEYGYQVVIQIKVRETEKGPPDCICHHADLHHRCQICHPLDFGIILRGPLDPRASSPGHDAKHQVQGQTNKTVLPEDFEKDTMCVVHFPRVWGITGEQVSSEALELQPSGRSMAKLIANLHALILPMAELSCS